LEVWRHYNSTSAYLGIFGPQWGHRYASFLVPGLDGTLARFEFGVGDMELFLPDGWDPDHLTAALDTLRSAALAVEELRAEAQAEDFRARLASDAVLRIRVTALLYEKGVLSPPEPVPGVRWTSLKQGPKEISSTASGYVLGSPGMSLEEYDARGRLEGLKDANGNAVVLVYESEGPRLVYVSSDWGGSLAFHYGTSGLVESVSEPGGGESAYYYDDAGRLVRVLDHLGNVQNYTYAPDPPHHLLAADTEGPDYSVADYWDADEGHKTMGYKVFDEDTERVFSYAEAVENNGRVLTVEVDRLYPAREAEDSEDGEWDGEEWAEEEEWGGEEEDGEGEDSASFGEPSLVHESTLQYHFTRDALGVEWLAKRENYRNGVLEETVYLDRSEKLPLVERRDGEDEVRYAYDGRGRLVSREEDGEVTEYEYDSVIYTKRSAIIRRGPDGDEEWSRHRFAYDARGNLVLAGESGGETLTMEYDARGRLVSIASSGDDGAPIRIAYNALEKPVRFSLEGVGSLDIRYDGGGKILDTESEGNGLTDIRIASRLDDFFRMLKMAAAN